ncbi:MAG: DUF2163 domain-containing protein, partial [Proteobacteria bacterium]
FSNAPAQPAHGLPPGYGPPEAYTSLDMPISFGGLIYDSIVNVQPTSIPTNLGLEIDSVDARLIFPQAAQLQRERVEAHVYDGALCHLFAYPWLAVLEGTATAADIIPLLAGRLGKARVTDEDANFEILSWASLINTRVGRTTGQYCDCARYGKGRCTGEDGKGIDITQHGRTVSGVVTAPPPGETAFGMRLWLDLDEARVTSWANWGILRITSGPMAGAELPVKKWVATGEIHLRLPLPVVPAAGTTIELEEGCDRTLKTCISKQPDPDEPTPQGNVIRFQGFDPPGQAKLVKNADGSAPSTSEGDS